MVLKNHLKALLLKNWLLWKRNLRGSLCELLVPCFLLCVLMILRVAFPADDKDGQSYAYPNNLDLSVGQVVSPPLYNDTFYLSSPNTVFDGLYTPKEQEKHNYDKKANLRFPRHADTAIDPGAASYAYPFDYYVDNLKHGWKIGYVPEPTPEHSPLNYYLHQEIQKYPKIYYNRPDLEVHYKGFKSNDKLEDYVTKSSYDDDNGDVKKKILFAIYVEKEPVFSSRNLETGAITHVDLDVKLRWNATDTRADEQTAYGQQWEIFATNYIKARDQFQRQVNTDYQEQFYKTGFIQTQSLIYNYLLRLLTPNDNAYISVAFTPMHGMDYVSDKFLQGNVGTLGFFLFISSLIPVVRLISRICTDKETKMREAMSMMGLTDTAFWLSWMITYTLVYLFIAIIATAITSWSLFPKSNFFLIFLMFFLYGLTCMAFSMLISVFFSRAKTAILVGVLVFFVTFFSTTSFDDNTPYGTKAGLSIFNTVAMTNGFFVILNFEVAQQGVQFDTAFDNFQHYNAGTALIFFAVDFFLYLFLALYLDKVIPSEYGRALPWYFPFTKRFWLGHQDTDRELNAQEAEIAAQEDQRYSRLLRSSNNIEPVDAELMQQLDSGKAMTIRGLRKQFGTKLAVAGLDLDIFEGQIFALLGHNGAGKTTTISMLSGLFEPTAGEMKVGGLDLKYDMDEMRKILGVCPQHNILWDDITVWEHLYLFSLFKGLTDKADIEEKIKEHIESVELVEKARTASKNLSGGMKRKLSLAIALIGDSKVVMLDEPTSGMDLTARRKMWDMLKNNKRGRIIILTTHYMEEADILADRIAIMSAGKLQCLGSSLFLKNKYGVGYSLTISKQLNVDSPEHTRKVLELIQEYIPDVEVVNDISAEIQLQIPTSAAEKFKDFFVALDNNIERLQLITYSISVTTLEEVFLRVARGEEGSASRAFSSIDLLANQTGPRQPSMELSNVTSKADDLQEEDEDPQRQFIEPADKDFNIDEHREKGIVFFGHFAALVRKRYIYSKRDYKAIICEIFLPILLVMLGLVLLTQISVYTSPKQWKEDISQYDTTQQIFYNDAADDERFSYKHDLLGDGPPADATTAERIMYYIDEYQGTGDNRIKPRDLDDTVADDYDDFDHHVYHKRDHTPYRMGSYYFHKADSELKQYEVVVFYNSTGYQSIPTYFNVLARGIIKEATGVTANLKLYNHPLPITSKQEGLAANAGAFFAAMIFCVGMAFIPTGLITFVVREREQQVKHQHLVSGVSVPAYWFSTYVWDMCKHFLPVIICCLMVLWFDLKSLSTNDGDVYLAVWLLFIFFGTAIAPFCYLTSFMFQSYAMAQFITFIFNLITGAILSMLVWLMRVISDDARDIANGLQYIFRLSPIFCFGFGIDNAANRETYAAVMGQDHIKSALDLELAGGDIMYLVIETFVYMIAVFLIEHFSHNDVLRKCGDAPDPGESEHTPDDDVESEMEVARKIEPNNVAVCVADLRKVYGNKFTKEPKVAIQRQGFTVKHSECFALLGVNGAGKTSTFRILTGEYGPTQGRVHVGGVNVATNMAEARYKIGYCPQFDALSELLTGREHLELYARIKGIPKQYIDDFVQQKLREMELKQYEHIRAGTYSGGNKRKLSVAMACIGNPPVVFLDEPSAGMDPGARKNMWGVINDIKSKKTSIILTTHSMEEAEALCERIGIMVDGRFRCLGSSVHIKNKFGKGYEFDIKIRSPEEYQISQCMDTLRPIIGENDFLTEANIGESCRALNAENLNYEITSKGSGAAIYWILETEKRVPVQIFVEWIIIERTGQRVYDWLSQFLHSLKLIEHYQTFYKFQLEKDNTMTIGYLFGVIEDAKDNLGISEYTLSQTTLEQIFNMFASQTTESERAQARNSRGLAPVQVAPS